jgi:hypothetical protein
MSEKEKNIITDTTNTYDKMPEYIESVFTIFKNIHKKGEQQKDRRLQIISLTIYNYVSYLAKTNNISLKEIKDPEPEMINMIPIFEYITYNNIELYDFLKIELKDVDITKKEDLERFVLTHIYYITQPNSL